MILLVTIYKPPEPVNQVHVCQKAFEEAVQFPGIALLLFSSICLFLEVFDLTRSSGDSLSLLFLREMEASREPV